MNTRIRLGSAFQFSVLLSCKMSMLPQEMSIIRFFVRNRNMKDIPQCIPIDLFFNWYYCLPILLNADGNMRDQFQQIIPKNFVFETEHSEKYAREWSSIRSNFPVCQFVSCNYKMLLYVTNSTYNYAKSHGSHFQTCIEQIPLRLHIVNDVRTLITKFHSLNKKCEPIQRFHSRELQKQKHQHITRARVRELLFVRLGRKMAKWIAKQHHSGKLEERWRRRRLFIRSWSVWRLLHIHQKHRRERKNGKESSDLIAFEVFSSFNISCS